MRGKPGVGWRGACQGGACGRRKVQLIPPGGRGAASLQTRPPQRPRPGPLRAPGPPRRRPRPAGPQVGAPPGPRPAHLPLPYVLPSRCNKVASTSCTRQEAGPGGAGAGARGGPGPASSPAAAAGPGGGGGGGGTGPAGWARGSRRRSRLSDTRSGTGSAPRRPGERAEGRAGAGPRGCGRRRGGAGERRNCPARPRPPSRPGSRGWGGAPRRSLLLLPFIHLSRATTLPGAGRQRYRIRKRRLRGDAYSDAAA